MRKENNKNIRGSALIEQWLKNKDTVLFLGVWEQINNPDLIPPDSRE